MSGVVLLGLLWAAVGILLGIRWWTERARWRATRPTPQVEADRRSRFGRGVADGSPRRLQAMLFAYASGATAVAVGLLTRTEILLGGGVLLVNVGTIYRFLVLALDREHLETPVLPARHRPAHTRRSQPGLSQVFVGRLAE